MDSKGEDRFCYLQEDFDLIHILESGNKLSAWKSEKSSCYLPSIAKINTYAFLYMEINFDGFLGNKVKKERKISSG